MSPVRLVVRVTLIVLIAATTLVLAVVYVSRFASGAMALSRQVAGAAPMPPMPEGYRPLHKGHIDLATGLYVREDEDVVLPGAPSFVLRRAYRTRDRRSRAFGVGASDTADWYLIGDSSTFQWAEVILEDGGRIHYDRVTTGTSLFNARFEHWTTPTAFFGSQLAWNGTDWIIRERNGTLLTFLACGPKHGLCGIASIRQPDGKTIRFRRNDMDALTRIEAGDQWIVFEHREGRISRIRDNAGQSVEYGYDGRGRLRQAVYSGGTKRTYDYDEQDRLIRIEEPGRIVENRYDAADMCVGQRVQFADGSEPYFFRFAYTLENGRVRQTDTWESNAPPNRIVFTVNGYVASETQDFDTDRAKTLTYERNPATGLVIGLTLNCAGGRWHTTRTLNATPATEDQVKEELLATPCVSR